MLVYRTPWIDRVGLAVGTVVKPISDFMLTDRYADVQAPSHGVLYIVLYLVFTLNFEMKNKLGSV